jgi:superfamily II DNA or RNA helicase
MEDLRRLLTFQAGDEQEPVSLIGADGDFFSGVIPWLIEQWKTVRPDDPLKIDDQNPAWGVGDDFKVDRHCFPNRMITLRDYQVQCVFKMIRSKRGIANLATGAGKTKIGIAVIHILRTLLAEQPVGRKALFVVGGVHLLNQVYDEFHEAGITNVGRVGDAFSEFDQPITVAICASLYAGLKRSDKDVKKLLEDVNILVFDECAHLKADSWMAIGSRCGAQYRYGLDAFSMDPEEVDANAIRLMGITGPVLVRLPASWLWRRGYLAEPLMTTIDLWCPKVHGFDWHKVYRAGIVDNKMLNKAMTDLAAWLYKLDLHVMLLTQQKDHALSLLQGVSQLGLPAVMMTGGQQVKYFDAEGQFQEQSWPIQVYREYVESRQASITVATPVFDEGINIPRMNALIPSGGVKKYRKVIQRNGRIMRAKKDASFGNRCFMFDFDLHNHSYFAKQFKERQAIYKREEYEVVAGMEEIRKLLGTST